MKQQRKPLRRKLRGKTGYSLGEALLAVLIVALLSMGVAAGVAFAVRQYRHAMIRSESRVLCSTLTSIIRNELATTGNVYLNGTDASDKELKGFSSTGYSTENGGQSRCFYGAETVNNVLARTADGFGQIYIARTGDFHDPLPLLPSAAYSSYHLQARVGVTYDGIYHVTLSVRAPDASQQIDTAFDVLPLMKPAEHSA